MKKFISLLLALAMTVSCFGVVSFAQDEDDVRPACVAAVIDPIYSAGTAFSDSINEIGFDSVNQKQKTGNITDIDAFVSENADDMMMGIDLDFLYNNVSDTFAWANYRIPMVDTHNHASETSSCNFKKMYDECAAVLLGNRVEYEGKDRDVSLFEKIYQVEFKVGNVKHYNYYFTLAKSELSLVRANTNLYLKRVISNYWGGGKFFTNDNVVKLTNFIGSLINPNFTLLAEGSRPVDDNVALDHYSFFGKIVELSGLGSLIENNWCNQSRIDFIPLMAGLGVQTDSLLSNEKTDGYFVGRRLLTDMYSEFCAAPLTYMINVVWSFARAYSTEYQDAFRALFSIRRSQVGNQYSEEELATMTGAFNFLSDAIDSVIKKLDSSKSGYGFTFSEIPQKRFALAVDHDELFLYMLCYMDINRIYKDNEIALENLWLDFEKAAKPVLTATELADIKTFYGSFLQGDFTIKSFLFDMLIDVTADNTAQIPNDFMNTLKVSIANLIKRFVDAIDNFVRILLGEKNPFERI